MSLDIPMTGPFAAVRETHIGVVFLIGELAYKLKKPVRTAFLDFSTGRGGWMPAGGRWSSTGGWPRMCISAWPRSPASTAVPAITWW
jgi:hypothetical protein